MSEKSAGTVLEKPGMNEQRVDEAAAARRRSSFGAGQIIKPEVHAPALRDVAATSTGQDAPEKEVADIASRIAKSEPGSVFHYDTAHCAAVAVKAFNAGQFSVEYLRRVESGKSLDSKIIFLSNLGFFASGARTIWDVRQNRMPQAAHRQP